MKKASKLPSTALALSMLCCAGCSTSVIGDYPDETNPEESERVSINFKVAKNNYTRAADDETRISTLHLAFYVTNGSSLTLHSIKEATATGDNSYMVIMANTGQLPDKVVAFANVTDSEALMHATSLADMKVDVLAGDDGSMVMSSARYYDTSNDNSDVYYSNITAGNWSGTGADNTVELYLERIAAKVTVDYNGGSITCEMLDLLGSKRNLTLAINNWDVYATDKESYLLKNYGGQTFSQIGSELSKAGDLASVWNKPEEHSSKWAHSVNWGKGADNYPQIGEENENSITRHVKFGDIVNRLGESAYVHESTRPGTLSTTPNARPSVVLMGQYKMGSVEQNLYRRGKYICTEEELIQYFINAQKELYFTDGKGGALKLTRENYDTYSSTLPYIAIVAPSAGVGSAARNMVTLQVVSETALNTFRDSQGNRHSNLDELNKRLMEECQLWEVYDKGRCFFTIPIEHFGGNPETDNMKTGYFGIVRNHHYTVNIKSITGFGHGVYSSDGFVGDMAESEDIPDGGDILYNVTVNPWTEKTQDVDITE